MRILFDEEVPQQPEVRNLVLCNELSEIFWRSVRSNKLLRAFRTLRDIAASLGDAGIPSQSRAQYWVLYMSCMLYLQREVAMKIRCTPRSCDPEQLQALARKISQLEQDVRSNPHASSLRVGDIGSFGMTNFRKLRFRIPPPAVLSAAPLNA